MRNRKLNQTEIDAINLFMSNICDIAIVEGVYIVPYLDTFNRKQGVRVIAIYNTESDYLRELNGNNHLLTGYDYTNLHTTVTNYNGFFQNTTGLSFFANDRKNYRYSEELSHAKKMSLQSLVSGTILFDRFGDVEKTRFKALNHVRPFKEAIQLRNVDKILPTNEAIQYQKNIDQLFD